MAVLARFFNVLPLTEATTRLYDGSLPPRAVSITFDDGYADNYTLAYPVLKRYGLPWTLFVATGYLDGGRMWNDAVIEAVEMTARDAAEGAAEINRLLAELKHLDQDTREQKASELACAAGALPSRDLMLTKNQLGKLVAGGVEIGGHTVSHPILKVASAQQAEHEIFTGKDDLESLLGRAIRSFAYPNGRPGVDYEDAHVELVRRAGYECAVSTEYGAADAQSDPLQLPRFGPWDESPLRFGLRLLRFYL